MTEANNANTRLWILAAYWVCVAWLPLSYAPAVIERWKLQVDLDVARLAVTTALPLLVAGVMTVAGWRTPRRDFVVLCVMLLVGIALINLGSYFLTQPPGWRGEIQVIAPVLSRAAWLIGCWCILTLLKARSIPWACIRQAVVGMRVLLVASVIWMVVQWWGDSITQRRYSSEGERWLLEFFNGCADSISLGSLLLFWSAVWCRSYSQPNDRGFEISPR